ncbi:eukaryotic translation initiation factor 2-alpha kinase, partial [Coemansia javaensis]
MDEATREIQQNELSALRAIFMEDYRDVVAKTAWKVKQEAPEFVIRVRPTDEALGERVWAGLHVRLPRAYPRAAAQATVEEAHGLSEAQAHEAGQLVRRRAEELAGGEAVYELAIALGEYMSANNSAAQAAQPSFHQQMVDRERAGQERERERAVEAAARRLRADQEELLELQARIGEELRRKSQARSDDRRHAAELDEAVHSVAGRWAEGIQLLRFDEPVELDPPADSGGGSGVSGGGGGGGGGGARFSTVALEEADVADGLCTVFDAYPTDLEAGAAAMATLSLAERFTVQCFSATAQHYVADRGRQQIERVGARVAALARVRHPNVLAVRGSRVEVVNRGGPSPAVCLWVLGDAQLAPGSSTLDELLAACGTLAPQQAGTYLRHILLALVALHAAGFIHRNVAPGNVLVVRERRARFAAKLFNTSYREELIALHRVTPLSAAVDDMVGSDMRVAPEVVDRPEMMGRKNDVWCAGVVGLAMVLGPQALRGVPIGAEPRVLAAHRAAMPPLLHDALALLLTPDHAARPSAMEALACPFFAHHHHHGLGGSEPPVLRQALDSASRGLTIADGSKAAAAPFFVAPENVAGLTTRKRPGQPSLPQPQPATSSSSSSAKAVRPTASRYRTDFEEIGFLGKGGFGSVVKARNLIDGRFYAIKKIKLDPLNPEGNKKIFREVTTLSRLHHQNVVRYYTTWVESVGCEDS